MISPKCYLQEARTLESVGKGAHKKPIGICDASFGPSGHVLPGPLDKAMQGGVSAPPLQHHTRYEMVAGTTPRLIVPIMNGSLRS